MKVLIITDNQKWIVDRITQVYQERIPFQFFVRGYFDFTDETLAQFIKENNIDLVHYNNWGIVGRFNSVMNDASMPQILTVRSFRIPNITVKYINSLPLTVHVINRKQGILFPNSVFIPDGVFVEQEDVEPFRIGMAFQDIPENWEYKGYNLVKRVCGELGLDLEVVNNKDHKEVLEWMKQLNLFVCASVDEGFSAPAMEALAMNVPVLTTFVGEPAALGLHEAHYIEERNYESVKEGILRYYTAPLILPDYSWTKICIKMEELYEFTIRNTNKK